MSTIPRMFLERVAATPGRLAYSAFIGGSFKDFTWRDYEADARDFGLGLLELGLSRGEVVAILGATSREWAICDVGALGAGGVTVGLYPTLAPEGVGSMHYVIDHSEARFLAVESGKVLRERIEPILGKIPRVEHLILWECDGETRKLDPRVTSFAEVCARGRAAHQRDGQRWRVACESARPEEVALLVYTSGTTGQPKGAMLTHGNIFAMEESLARVVPLQAGEEHTVSFLPMAHAAERVVAHYGRIRQGYATRFARSMETLLADLADARPTLFGSVPRVFEKVFAQVQGKLASARGLQGIVARAAWRAGLESFRQRRRGEVPGLVTRLLAGIFEKKIAASVRAIFGGRCAWLMSGAAPIAVEILEFFDACGLRTYEAYGMTETSGLLTINCPEALRFGTVGKPMPGIEVRVAADGEIQARGPNVFKGYCKEPEATKAAFTDDGWYCTGDIGVFDNDGFLKITDRKKNILITAGGKNITPSNIENEVKAHPLISYCHLHADRRAYPVALICLDPAELKNLSEAKGLSGPLHEHAAVRQVVQGAIDRANARFAQYEQIRKFAIVPAEFSMDSGELTPTLKVKRKVVDTKYATILDALYAEPRRGAA